MKIDTGLELRQLELSDSIDIFNTINNQRKSLGKWLPFVASTNSLEDIEIFVSSVINTPKDNFEYTFTISKLDEFVGLIGFKSSDKQTKKTEIEYWISDKFKKMGILTKSVNELCVFAFKDQGFNRIQIKCDVENRFSANIPKILGFKFEGIEREGKLLSGKVFTDLEVYSKLKND